MKKFGLSKKERLLKKTEFEKVFKLGLFHKDSRMTIRTLSNQLGLSRVGVVVSKKRVKKAVHRNRLKRLIREAFRLSKHQIPKGLDIMVNLKKIDGADLKGIQKSLLKLLG